MGLLIMASEEPPCGFVVSKTAYPPPIPDDDAYGPRVGTVKEHHVLR